MCNCTSCEYTDGFAGKGFDAWPKGNPSGRKSATDYSAHVAYSKKTFRHEPGRHAFSTGKWIEEEKLGDHYRKIPKHPVYSCHGTPGCGPVQPAPKFVLDWINRKAPDQAEARPASPETPAKAPQHFPELDRERETARIYAMPKSKDPKQPRGRPAINGRRVVIKLTEEQIKRAEKKGNGNVSEGIRKALSG